MYIYIYIFTHICMYIQIHEDLSVYTDTCIHKHVFAHIYIYLDRFTCVRGTGIWRGGGLGSRPKKMYGERLGDGVEYHLMKPTPRR